MISKLLRFKFNRKLSKEEGKYNTLTNSREIVNNILEEFLQKKNLHTLEDLPSKNSKFI